MKRSEVAEIIQAIEGLYPTFKPPSPTNTVNEWWNVLGKYEYHDAKEALYIYAAEPNKYAPSAGELANITKELTAKKGKKNNNDYYARKQTEALNAYLSFERDV